MEFRFNVNEIFKYPVVEINSSLIPPGLSLADKRALWDAVGKVSDVVNAMGEASATAQGLTKPITTSERLRNSEHKLYLLLDQNANNGKGVVTGMLKTGKKGLYVFDRDGHHYQVQPACVLDFYVHESKQRMGLGKRLFEHMLEKEQVEPIKMAIDRPSDKFLGFLNKHYGLDSPVKQMNNFVVFDGFFPETKDDLAENNNTPLGKSNQPANGLQSNYSSPYGRYGAPRPPCSMGQIIHNQSSLVQQSQEPAGTSLKIRAPNKNRSIYSDKRQTDSNGNRQSSQKAPSTAWNSNQNSPSHPQFQNYQQSENNYMSANAQMMDTQNRYLNSQNQQQAFNNMYNQANDQYSQMQYGVQQNFQQPHKQNQVNVYHNQQQQNQYTSNTRTNNQQPFAQPHLSQQQYMSDQTQNAQITQHSRQAGDIQMQQKKSVQFVPDQQNAQTVTYIQPTQSQPIYQQKPVQLTQESQVKSVPNVAYEQQYLNINTAKYMENVSDVSQIYQGQQNNFHNNQQSTQNIQQQLNTPQTYERVYQYEQPPQAQQFQQQQQDTYQPQHTQQNTYQQQLQPDTYQAPQTQQNTYTQPAQSVIGQSQQPQQVIYQWQQEKLQPRQASQAVYQTSQPTYQPQYSQQPQQLASQQRQERLQPHQESQTVYHTSQPAYQSQYSQQLQHVANQQKEERIQPRQGLQTPPHSPNTFIQRQQLSHTTCAPRHSSQTQQQFSETTTEQQYDRNKNIQEQINPNTYQNYSKRDGRTQVDLSQSTVNQQNDYQNLQTPTNYPMNQQSTTGESQPIPILHNVSNQQIPSRSTQNVQITNQTKQSQHNIPAPQQPHPQIQHQIDPSTIIPPVEAANNQMNKNYQYYDSNSERMQGVSDKVKYTSGTGVGMPPNASGDMQPK